MVVTETAPEDGTGPSSFRPRRWTARRPSPSFVLLRQIAADSVIHRLWAGTKLVIVAAFGFTLSFRPDWPALGLVVVVLLAGTVLAHIPIGAVPRLPVWFWITVLVGLALTLVSGGAPYLDVGGARLGLAGLEVSARFLILGFVLLWSSALIGWTTPLGEIAPALARLGAPLRVVRLPVDEWAVVVALCVRGLPLLVTELRVLVAVRRLRSGGSASVARSWRDWRNEPIDFLTAVLAVSLRRAGELGEAIQARGGTGLISARRDGPGRTDAAALAVVAAAVAGSFALT